MIPLTVEKDPVTGRYILRIDASLYIESDCIRSVAFENFFGLVTQSEKSHVPEYGSAGHRYLESRYGGNDEQSSIQAAINYYSKIHVPESDWRNSTHLINCLMQYHKAYGDSDPLKPLIINGQRALEKRFQIPFFSSPMCDVTICGVIDMLADFFGHAAIVDHKFTALTDVDGFLRKYLLSPQLMLYTTIFSSLFPSYDGRIGAMVNGIFLNRANKNNFKRSEVFYFTQEQLKLFLGHFKQRVVEICEAFEEVVKSGGDISNLLPNYSRCVRQFGMCPYVPICSVDKSDNMMSVAATEYKQRVYDPMHFQK